MSRQRAPRPAVPQVDADSLLSRVLSRAPATVVLVEGLSDQAALQVLATRCSRDLAAEGTCVVPMGGATSVGRFWRALGPQGAGLRVTGLCDAAEERHFQRAAGSAGSAQAAGADSRGVFVCTVDLEDELIRALGVEAVEEVVARTGELGALRTFQQQPAQRDRSAEAQVRRFLGTRSGRKVRYARLLAERLDLNRLPPPLERLLHHIS